VNDAWLASALAAVAADPAEVHDLFPAAGRNVGLDAADESRMRLIDALGAHVDEHLERLYQHGEATEQRAVLRWIGAQDLDAPGPPVATALVADALRTNDTRLLAAALGPWSVRHLDAHTFRHGVLKCVFSGVSVAGLAGVADRVDDELLRMLAAFRDEREAAGRVVPDDLDGLLGRGGGTPTASASPAAPKPRPPKRRIFEPHVHMTSRTTDDYEAMYAAGVRAVVEPAFWLGQPRTNPGSFADYFDAIVGWERFRAAQFGIRHHCTIALNPKEANDPRVREAVLEMLPRYLAKDGVVAVGEVGYDSMTRDEDEAFAAQVGLAAAAGLPVLVHTPHRDKLAGTERSLDLLAAAGFPPERALIDHNNEMTVALVVDSGCWVGFSIYPDTKMDEQRMVKILAEFGTDRMIVNSAADWGRSDPLKVARVADAMAAAGFSDEDIDKVVWRNPVEFFAQSGRLDLGELGDTDPTATFEGNSILRGARSPAGGWGQR
jgi:uncharacterized protein